MTAYTKKTYNLVPMVLLTIAAIMTMNGCGRKATLEQQGIDRAVITEAEKKYESPDWKVRQQAIQSIAGYSSYGTLSFSDKNAEELLLRATEDIHGAVRIESLKGLANYRSNAVLNRLITIAGREKNENVRWFALLSLAQHKSTRALPVFLENLKHSDWLIREAAIKGILLTGDEKLLREMEPQIISSINDTSISVKITTMRYLTIKSPGIYDALRKIIMTTPPPPYSLLRATLETIKGYSLDSATREKIIGLLAHPNTTIRILALRVLKEEQNVPIMKERKNDEKEIKQKEN